VLEIGTARYDSHLQNHRRAAGSLVKHPLSRLGERQRVASGPNGLERWHLEQVLLNFERRDTPEHHNDCLLYAKTAIPIF